MNYDTFFLQINLLQYPSLVYSLSNFPLKKTLILRRFVIMECSEKYSSPRLKTIGG